jgi:CO/xanthine dehydrogenase FAD-binding subunit
VTEATAEAAGKAAVADARPLSQNAYKVTLARVAVKRALLNAVQAAKG